MKRDRSRPVPTETPKLDASMRRVQSNLAITMALCLMALIALGRNVGDGTQLAQTSGLAFDPSPLGASLSGLCALIVLNALFVAAETAVELLRPMHVRFVRETQSGAADKLQKLLDAAPRYAAAMSLARQISWICMVVVCFTLAPNALQFLSSQFGWESTTATLVASWLMVMAPVGFIDLIAGNLIPKSFAVLHPTRVANALFGFIRISSLLFAPLSAVVIGAAGLFTARFGGKASFTIENQAEQEIKTIVESANVSGEIEAEEKELLHSVFEFTDTVAREVMTPRVDLDAMPVKSDPTDVMRVIQESGHSRIPLFEDSDDQIVGIIHAKDLFMAMVNKKAPNLRTLMRPALFVPENKALHELLAEMKLHRTQMAIVQDEFGGTAGIVTIEDIVEELVGDIVDEYDVEEPEIQASENGWLVDGKTHVDDVNREISSEISSDDFDTIGGYVFGLFGRQPAEGEFIDADGFRFCIAETDGRRLAKLRIEKLEPADATEEPSELI